MSAFTGTLATRVVQLKPYDPESKGIVERRNQFFETSFMPGRTFTSPADFNAQFTAWLELANRKVVRTIKAAPVDLIERDRAGMLPLPPVPLQLGWMSPPISTASESAQAAGSSPITRASGLEVRRSPIPPMSRPRGGCESSSSSPDRFTRSMI